MPTPKTRNEVLEVLLSVLAYNEDSGEVYFTFPLKSRNGSFIEVRTKPTGYKSITYCGFRFFVHRLIFLLKGLPEPLIVDHVNQDKSDNRWVNLRSVNKRQNNTNQGLRKDNTSGYKGVYYHKDNKSWMSRISLNGKMVYLGSYPSVEEAANAYDKAVSTYHGEHGWRNNNGTT